MKDQEIGFIDFFSQIPDHQMDRRKLHPVEEILLLTFCGMIAGCDSWEDLELFGKTKKNYLFSSPSAVSIVGIQLSFSHPELLSCPLS